MNVTAVKSEEDAIIVAKEELSKTGQQGELEVLYVWKLGPKDTSMKKEGWMVFFKSNLPEGFEPEIGAAIYPSIGEVRMPGLR